MTVDIEATLPPPELCDHCCSTNVELTTNDRIYGEQYGRWPKIYFCNDCRASVGCHPGTEIPLGRMADRQTRQLRTKAHEAFDQLWKIGLMTRSKAYAWLAVALGIDPVQCHISWLSKDQLRQTVTLSSEYLEKNLSHLERRKDKENAKQRKQAKREESRKRIIAEFKRRRKAKH